MQVFNSRAPTISDRIGFNRRFYAENLETVFTPSNDDELVDAVKQASTPANPGDDPGIRIVSGRHCYENFVFNSTSRSLIDCVALDAVGHDPDRGYFVESGASNWSSFQRLLTLFGKNLPGGSCYSVGIGGHISGGGYGLLSRLQGLTVDWLTGVDIVVTSSPGEAKLLHVDASSDPDLFWALRGAGGGNFGAIARFYFKELPTAPDKAEITSLGIPWSAIPDAETLQYVARQLYDAVHTEYPETDPLYWGVFAITKFFHQLKSGSEVSGAVDFLMQSANPDLALEDVVSDILREFSSSGISIHRRPAVIHGRAPLLDRPTLADVGADIQVFSIHDAVQTLNGSGSNQYGKYKSAYHKGFFSPDQFEPLFSGLTEYPTYNGEPVDMSNAWVQADSYGGAINLVDPASTPINDEASIPMSLGQLCSD